MIELDLVRVLADMSARLDRLSIPFHVGGSVASSTYGEPRLTRDLDLVVELGEPQLEALLRVLEPDYYVSREAGLEAIRGRRSFNAVHIATGVKVDLFVRGDSLFDREEFRRAVPTAMGDGSSLVVPVKAPEDTILRKLLWFRAGGETSDQQWRDVLALLALNAGVLDDAHLDRWASDLGLSELLARARAQSAA